MRLSGSVRRKSSLGEQRKVQEKGKASWNGPRTIWHGWHAGRRRRGKTGPTGLSRVRFDFRSLRACIYTNIIATYGSGEQHWRAGEQVEKGEGHGSNVPVRL